MVPKYAFYSCIHWDYWARAKKLDGVTDITTGLGVCTVLPLMHSLIFQALTADFMQHVLVGFLFGIACAWSALANLDVEASIQHHDKHPLFHALL